MCNVWTIQYTVTNERKKIVYCRLFCCYRRIRFVFGSFFFLMYIFICCILTASIERTRLGRCACVCACKCVGACACLYRLTFMNHIRTHQYTRNGYARISCSTTFTFIEVTISHWYNFKIRLVLSFLARRRNKPNQWDYSMRRTISFNAFLFLLFIHWSCSFHTYDFLSFFVLSFLLSALLIVY